MSSFLRSALDSLFCLLWTGVVLAGAQDWESCDFLQRYTELHPNCSISNYGEPCSGLFCHRENAYFAFSVQKCEDPVTVAVVVYIDEPEENDSFEYLYNKSETVNSYYGDRGHYTAIMERNASHLGFDLYVQHFEGSWIVISLFHDVYIPLDPADCMCSSVENVAADIQLRTSYNCSTTARCMQILCNVINTNSSLQSVDIVVNSCDNPPSLSLGVHTLDSSWTMHATDNTTMSLDGVGVVMLLKIWHYNYSMDVELTAVSDTTTEIILSRHKIILDLTECGPLHPINMPEGTIMPPTEFTQPTPTATDSTYDTCEALHSISVVDGNLCSANRACNALECEIVNQRLEMAVDSCHDPPGIRLVVYDSTNHPVFNRSFYNGSHIVHNGNLPFNLNVTVLQIPPSAISVEITGESFGYKIPLVPKTVIPIDQSSCSTLQPPTSAPGTTCSAMQYIQSALARRLPGTSCYFPLQHNCTVLTCSVEEGVDMTIRLLRCAHPPAVRVTLGNSFLTYFDHTFDHSEVIPLNNIPNLNDASLKVTMDQLCPSDIGFQVDLLSGGLNVPLIPYTIIPVNTTGCGPSGSGMVCSSITASPTSSTVRSSTSSGTKESSTSSGTMGSSTPSGTTRSSTTSECSGGMCSSITTLPNPTPFPKPPFASSCDAMENILGQLNSKNELIFLCVQKGCGEIDCLTKSSSKLNIILHCSPPIGMKMEVYTNNNTGSNIFTKSGTFFNNSMDVTVNIGNNVLGFGVVYSGRTLINYTLIPLVTCVDSSGPASSSGLSTAAMESAIAVPVVLLLLIVTVVVIVVGIYLVRRRRGRNYRFHRMHNKAMSELDEDC